MSKKKEIVTYDDYVRGIDKLNPEQQLHLVELLSEQLKKHVGKQKKKHKITELEGLGAETWKNIETEEYLRKERDSWD